MNDFAEPAPAEQSPVPEAPVQDSAPQVEGKQDDQTNDEPKEQPRRSRREALEKAFADLDQPEPGKEPANRAVAKDDKAKAGQNGEPATQAQPERGPDGKFVSKEQAAPAADPKKAEAQADGKSDAAKPDKAAGTGHDEAPARFSADAKAAWKEAPEPIRAEAHRAIREMEQGIAEYKSRVEPLEPFYQMARTHGVKLEDALGRYVNLENMLRQDPVRGFQEIASNMGMSPQQVAQMLQGGQPGQADPRDQQIMSLRQELQQLKQGFGQINQGMQDQRQSAVLNQIEQFAAQNPRFDELSNSIAEMLQTGFAKDLQDAYDKADRLNPAPAPDPQPDPTPAPAQTREPKSVTGAPSAGSNPAQRKPSTNRTEALKRAFDAAGL
jgi:hypothetical protein